MINVNVLATISKVTPETHLLQLHNCAVFKPPNFEAAKCIQHCCLSVLPSFSYAALIQCTSVEAVLCATECICQTST